MKEMIEKYGALLSLIVIFNEFDDNKAYRVFAIKLLVDHANDIEKCLHDCQEIKQRKVEMIENNPELEKLLELKIAPTDYGI